MSTPIEQSALTSGVKQYYEASGQSGIGDRNSQMLAGLTTEQLLPENLHLLGPELARLVLIHHHFGIGRTDRDPSSLSQSEITEILYQWEQAQVQALLVRAGEIGSEDVVLDAGSGRGGTAFTINDMLGAQVHGVTISEYQREFCERLAAASAREGTHFHLMDMTNLTFPPETFTHVVQNETDMYVLDLAHMFGGFARVLRPGGRFASATWVRSADHPESSEAAAAIDVNYACLMHADAEYGPALQAAGFGDIQLEDLTADALPYWQVRAGWDKKSGVEQHYIDGYQSGALKYMMVSAKKQ